MENRLDHATLCPSGPLRDGDESTDELESAILASQMALCARRELMQVMYVCVGVCSRWKLFLLLHPGHVKRAEHHRRSATTHGVMGEAH